MKRSAVAAVLLQAFATQVYAQSSVTMYGSIDNGITYVNNVAGKSILMEQGGISRANAFGVTGTEELGGGLSTVFKLENGFSTTTGALGQGGLLFGKQAYVGLHDDSLGELTFGRHYDFTVLLEPYMPCIGCGIYSVENADLDRISGERLNNSARFRSASYGGFSFGAMYAFGQYAGPLTMNAGRAYSGFVQYEHGPFSAMAVVTDINGAPIGAGQLGARTVLGMPVQPNTTLIVDNQRIAALGASYKLGKWTPSLTYSNTQLKERGMASTDQLLRLGTTYSVTPATLLSGQVSVDHFEQSRWYTVNLGLDYYLSHSTDVYVDLAAQKASGPQTMASIFLAGTASTSSQFLSRVGVKHIF
ncbi:porin [Paraburkholderia silviterrae]|uniref:Porin n=1 Tax=Paraburkholderia silviterrae TaxID=2528715 RepID=A0A4R5M7H5_9BURK|nr:porin [Paraburkholderia silviterrae]TDG22150.1 porin [Paraburkholderia silviterrae]